jgi:hypothetical protein
MIKEHFWSVIGVVISTIAINITISTLFLSDMQDDIDRLEDRVEFLTKAIMRETLLELD